MKYTLGPVINPLQGVAEGEGAGNTASAYPCRLGSKSVLPPERVTTAPTHPSGPSVAGGFLCPERQVRKIAGITSLEELQGFEAAAKTRGVLPEELAAIHQKRIQLTPKNRRRK